MRMSKIRTLLYTLLLGLGFSQETTVSAATSPEAQPQSATTGITLKDVTGGTIAPQHVYGVHPLNDGESYSQLSGDGKRIVRSSFKTGKEIGVIFDVEKARGTTKLSHIDGYIMSPDEKKILLHRVFLMLMKNRRKKFSILENLSLPEKSASFITNQLINKRCSMN